MAHQCMCKTESVVFSLEDFMDLEFKSWLCICEYEYLKLEKVTLFEKVIDYNLIYDHDLFVCQELINSGMLLINLAILKLFIADRISRKGKISISIWMRASIWMKAVMMNSSTFYNIMKRLIPILWLWKLVIFQKNYR